MSPLSRVHVCAVADALVCFKQAHAQQERARRPKSPPVLPSSSTRNRPKPAEGVMGVFGDPPPGPRAAAMMLMWSDVLLRVSDICTKRGYECVSRASRCGGW